MSYGQSNKHPTGPQAKNGHHINTAGTTVYSINSTRNELTGPEAKNQMHQYQSVAAAFGRIAAADHPELVGPEAKNYKSWKIAQKVSAVVLSEGNSSPKTGDPHFED